MSIAADPRTIPFADAHGAEKTLADYGDGVILVVNVASKCGFTPQYEQLEQLQRAYGDRGLTVVGFPCNQFMGQEPGSTDEVVEYCTTTWGVTFPIADKVRVNGSHAAPLFKALKKTKDGKGLAGPVAWNFEKFLVLPSGEVRRFRSKTVPDDPAIVRLIEEHVAS
ncbi:glutathione peroxidase [Microbacterium karelineae]|uniref:glutathione peroxidase n=1 Tax=Microbacterium karelineae TaxID=2654283 RepID=UPI0012E9BE9B|nr:glutathione peroxidase [Microbacterium karelineae]